MEGENALLFDLPKQKTGSQQGESERSQLLKRIEKMKQRELRNLENKLQHGKTLTAAERDRLKELEAEALGVENGNLPEYSVSTAREVAAHFKRTVRTIRNWTGQGMPQLLNGYDLRAIGLWALERGFIADRALIPGGEAETPAARPADQEDRSYYEAQIKRLDSELKEIRLQKERGLLIERSQVAQEWASRLAEVARGLDYLSSQLPPLLEGKNQGEMRTIIADQVWNIRDQFARTGRFCPSGGENIES